jgi:hypothetical protein
MKTITQKSLEELSGGKRFDVDELILIRVQDAMITIRQSDSEEIRRWRYDVNVGGDDVELKLKFCDKITPKDYIFGVYRQKLEDSRLWH